jgi:hypothetical protein
VDQLGEACDFEGWEEDELPGSKDAGGNVVDDVPVKIFNQAPSTKVAAPTEGDVDSLANRLMHEPEIKWLSRILNLDPHTCDGLLRDDETSAVSQLGQTLSHERTHAADVLSNPPTCIQPPRWFWRSGCNRFCVWERIVQRGLRFGRTWCCS